MWQYGQNRICLGDGEQIHLIDMQVINDEFALWQVECLKGSGNLNFEDIKFENENGNAARPVEEDSESDASEFLIDDP